MTTIAGKYSKLILALIVLAGGGLRFSGLDWGTDPGTGTFHTFHPDENLVIDGSEKVGGNLSEVKTSYGKAPMYLLWAVAELSGKLANAEPFDRSEKRFLYITARSVSALMGTMTLCLVFGIGCRLHGYLTGLLSASLLGFSAGHIQQSHFYTVDVQFTFWVALALLLILNLPSKSRWNYLLCGVVCGLATGTRLAGTLLVIPFLVVHVPSENRANWKGYGTPAALYIVSFLAVTLLCEPYLILDPASYFGTQDVRQLMLSIQVARGKYQTVWALFDYSTTTYLYYFTNLFRYALGMPLEIAGLVGALVVLKFRNMPGLVILSWVVPYFLLVGGLHTRPIRYTAPMLPVFAALAAWACVFSGRWLSRWTPRTWAGVVPALVVGLPTIAYGVAMTRVYQVEDSRIAAGKWVRDNIPPSSTVLTERGGFPTMWMAPEDRYHRRVDDAAILVNLEGHFPYSKQIEWVEEKLIGTDWIVVVEENRMRQFLAVPDRFPIGYEFYRLLNSGGLGFEKVMSFQVYPGFGNLSFGERDSEPSFSAFDHPRVSVFERVADVAPIIAKWSRDVSEDQNLPDRYVRRGLEAYDKELWQEAEMAFRLAVDSKEGFFLGHLLLRESYLRQGMQESAKKEELEVISRAGMIPVQTILGMIAVGLKEEGASLLEQFAAANPVPYAEVAANTRIALGVALQQEQKFKAAIDQFQRALTLAPDLPQVYLNVGRLHYSLGEYESAIEILKLSLQRDSLQPANWVLLAQILRESGDLDDALESLEKALNLIPNSRVIWSEYFFLGSQLHESGLEERALSIYQNVIRHDPELIDAHLNLALLNFGRGAYSESLIAFQTVIQLAPDDLEANLGIAQTYERLGRFDEAINSYLIVLRIDSENRIATERLAALRNRKTEI